MKWLFYEKETNTRAKVVLIYHVEPTEELLNNGNYIRVENVPEPIQVKGKSALPYCNPKTKEVWYEYVDKTITEDDKIAELEKQVNALNIAIAEIMGV